jgi:hypothetical protein
MASSRGVLGTAPVRGSRKFVRDPDRLEGDAHPGLAFQGERVGRGAAASTHFSRCRVCQLPAAPSASAGALLEKHPAPRAPRAR